MKYIKLFEYISNVKNMKYLLSNLLRDISKIVIDDEVKWDYTDYDNQLKILNIDSKYHKKIEKILKKYEKNFLERNNIIMNYDSSSKYKPTFFAGNISVDKNTILYDYYIIVKDINIGRVKPERYLIHKTLSKYTPSIKEKGLVPSKSQNYKGEELSINYPPAIFALAPNRFSTFKGDYFWIIDTTKCNNKWFKDLNFPNQKGIYMTYDPIPKEALITNFPKSDFEDWLENYKNKIIN